MSEKIIDRVAKLLAHAEGTSNSEERATYMAKADELMTAHRIEEWQLEMARRGETARPEPVRRTDRALIDRKSPIRVPLLDLTSSVARFCRVKMVWHGLHSTHLSSIGVNWIGLERDIEYARTLLASLRVQMTLDLTPGADKDATLDENIIALKEAGLKWAEVHDELAIAGFEPYASEEHLYKHAVKLSKRYALLCEREGRPQMKTNPVTYKRSFAEGFVMEVQAKMREVAKTRRAHEAEAGDGYALELHDQRSAVDKLYDELYPKSSLSFRSVARADGISVAGRNAGKAAGRRADIGLDRVSDGRGRALPGGG